MTDRTADPIDRTRMPVQEWGISETRYDRANRGAIETVFAVGNGYLGLRGNHEEGDADAHRHGTFLNGFHETWPIHHAEEAFGFARTGQTIVNVPDPKGLLVSVDGEALRLSEADLPEFGRTLDFRDGILRRSLTWRTSAGKTVHVHSTRMVSFTRRTLAVMSLAVSVDAPAQVVITSTVRNRQDVAETAEEGEEGFDPRKAGGFDHRVLLPHVDAEDQGRMLFGYRTANSDLALGIAVDHDLFTENAVAADSRVMADLGQKIYTAAVEPGKPVLVVKSVAYHTGTGEVDDLLAEAQQTLDAARAAGLDALEAEQRQWLADFWANTDVELAGQPEIQQAVRWCLFQLAQASARSDGGGIGVKGVSGSGYEGHYFWDTEVYLVPFLAHTNPEIARNALRFRIGMLPAARRRARELSQKGALFPWRTINGEEASAYYAAGTAQYHINADVAFAMAKYADVCGDPGFLTGEALPVLVETARLWVDLGFFRGPERSFHIHSVTGPDEYTAVVNNNLYTNVMARANLRRAAAAVRDLAAGDPAGYAALAADLRLAEAEVDTWEAAAAAMTIPFDERFGVHAEDEDFLGRKVWDIAATPADKRPLLLHYHPLVIYRHQVLKQADTVLALFMAGDEFTTEAKRADYEYYDPITTGDSTLSAVVQSIIAAEVGYQERALESFMDGIFVDLADLHHNTGDGVHIASAGGVWNALVYGFGGLRDYHGALSLDPRLPESWPSLRFPVRLSGSRVRVELTASQVRLTVEDGPGGTVTVRGNRIELRPGAPVTVDLPDQGPRLPSLTGSRPYIHGRPATDDQITIGVPDPE